MATNRILQLLRSNQVYGSKELAVAAVGQMTGADGEIRLARYNAGTEQAPNVKSLLCVYHASPNLPNGTAAGWTYIEDASANQGTAASVQAELDNLEAQVGQDGASTTFASGATSGSDAEQILTGAQDNTGSAPTNLTNAVTNVATYIGTLDKTASAVDGQVVTTISQTNGQVAETKADLTDVKMGGYSKTSDTGAIAATDTLEVAVSKLENAIDAAEVHSNDQSITVAADATNGGTNIEVNVDGTTIVKDSTSHAIKGNYTLHQLDSTELAALNNANVKEAYQLQTINGSTAIGDVVKIYKDSALQEVYLGADTDTVNASTGVVTKNTVTDPQSMNFVYQLADGTYSMTKIDVSKFLTESEFGDGLSVSNAGVVSVNPGNGIEIDNGTVAAKIGDGLTFGGTNNDEITVLIDNTNDTHGYLSVSANGVALNGDAIDDAIENAATTLTEVAAQSPAERTADGTDFIKVVASTESDGHTNYAVSTQGIKDAIAVETARAESAEQAIDAAVGLTKAQNGETRSYTSQVTLGSNETAPTTVAGDIALLNSHVKALDDAAVKSVDVASGETVISVDNTDPQNPEISFNLSQQAASTAADASYAGGNDTSNILQIKNDGLYLSNVWDCGTY